MANQDQGGRGSSAQGGSGNSGRGFAGMDDEQQREIAQKGGEASARTQKRADDGQFAGKRSGGSSRPAADRRAARPAPAADRPAAGRNTTEGVRH